MSRLSQNYAQATLMMHHQQRQRVRVGYRSYWLVLEVSLLHAMTPGTCCTPQAVSIRSACSSCFKTVLPLFHTIRLEQCDYRGRRARGVCGGTVTTISSGHGDSHAAGGAVVIGRVRLLSLITSVWDAFVSSLSCVRCKVEN